MDKPKMGLMRTLLLVGMGLMIPCYLFTAGNTIFAPWELYSRNRPVLFLLTAVCFVLLLVLMRAAKHPFFVQHERAVLVGFALFYFAVQMTLGAAMRFEPITDLEQCYTAGQLLADTGEFGNLERPFIYFTRYPHNLGLVYLFAGIFRFFGVLGWHDRFMQALLVCSALFTLGLLASAGLSRRLGGPVAKTRVLLLFATCLPFLYCTTELYTDAFSLAFCSIIVYAFVRARGAETARGRVGFALLFALAAFVGAQLRATSLIAAIGCLIAALFDKRFSLTALLFVPLALVLAVGGSAVDAENARHLGKENIEKYKLPILHYVAMGLPVQVDEGYGQYGEGGWLVFSTSFDDPKERDAALLQEVIDRVYTVRYPNRLLHMMSRKNLSTFGNGTFQLNEIIEGDHHEPDNLVKQVVFRDGIAYPAYYHLTTAMFAAQMLLACAACVQAIRRRDVSGAAIFVTLLGAFLLLSMWETRARYFFQFTMLLQCAGAQYRCRDERRLTE